MDSKNERFDVEFTEECIEEMIEIYDYISIKLKENKIAKRLFKEVNNKILNLSISPEIYIKIGKVDKLNNEYRRMIVKNYIVLYTIDYDKKKIFISRMIYKKQNYIN